MHYVQMSLPIEQIAASEAADLERAVGARIRGRRQLLGLTLGELGAGCGLSSAFLSRLERGQATTTIAGLLQIARALGVEPSTLLAEAGPEARFGVHRAGAAAPRAIGASGYAWQAVAAPWPGQRLSAFELRFPVDEAMPTRVSHAGEEVCVVLEGEVLFEVEGSEHRLGPGDAIHLDSALPHRARGLGGRPARMLMVTSGAQEPGRSPEWWSTTPDTTKREEEGGGES